MNILLQDSENLQLKIMKMTSELSEINYKRGYEVGLKDNNIIHKTRLVDLLTLMRDSDLRLANCENFNAAREIFAEVRIYVDSIKDYYDV